MKRSLPFKLAILSLLLLLVATASAISINWIRSKDRPLASFFSPKPANADDVDKQADKVLKQMSDYLTAMPQFSYKSKGTFEVVDEKNQKQQQAYQSEVFVKRP